MRLGAFTLLLGVGCVAGDLVRGGVSGFEKAYEASFLAHPSRESLRTDDFTAGEAVPFVVLELSEESSTLKKASVGGVYEIVGSVRQLVGDLKDYVIEVEGLGKDFGIIGTELLDGNRFKVSVSVGDGVEAGKAYSYKLVAKGKEGDEKKEAFEFVSVIPVEAETDLIRIAAFNDFHGYIVQQKDRNTPRYTGALSMSFALEELRNDLVEKDVIVVGAGDSIGGTLFESAVDKDMPTKHITRMWGTQCQALGNHEFDYGWKDIQEAAEVFDFPQLGANILWKEKVEGGKEVGEVFMEATHIVEVKRADRTYKIGFVGVTLESLPTVVLAEGVAPLDFVPAAPEANKWAKKLKEKDNCDIVVCLFHQGGSSSSATADAFITANEGSEMAEFMKNINSEGYYIDLLATGHTHQRYNWNVPKSTINPNLPPVVQTGSFAQNVAVFDLTIDAKTRDLVVDPTEVHVNSLLQPIWYDYETNKWMEEEAVVETAKIPRSVIEINEVIIKAIESAEEKGSVPVAKSNVTWPAPSGTETILGCHIADAMLAATAEYEGEFGVQFAFTNDGGIRKDWVPTADDDITVRHVYDTLPFNNELEAMNLTGALIKSLLETQWRPNGASERFLHLQSSGIRYKYNTTNPIGERVDEHSMLRLNRQTNEWKPMSMKATYRVVTNNFLSTGGDAFVEFVEGTERRYIAAADNKYTIAYTKAMAEANDGHLVPAAVERAYNALADRRNEVELVVHDHVHGSGVQIHLDYMTESETRIQGPFRIIYSVNKGEYNTILVEEPTYLDKDHNITQEIHIDRCQNGCLVFASLVSEVFHKNPLPHGLEYSFRVNDVEGAMSSIAAMGALTAAALTALLAF